MAEIVSMTSSRLEVEFAAAKNRTNHTGTQLAATISDFAEALQDGLADALVAGSNITISYNDATGKITISSSGGGSGTSNVYAFDHGSVASTARPTVAAGTVVWWKGSVYPNNAIANDRILLVDP